ncbi:MAG TPA: GreA/GreB family elongation factor [Bacteroidales bacterium]|nr:GreA/GreB family elongation factor [Bacteroidales bacterium]HRZ76440.1 GreA/GreB family elongation factor [Bacteroidales bacterium]
MSRGFVKEDDQEEVPMVAPRAHLPRGVTNYVTPAGMEQLLAERKSMLDEIAQLDASNEKERRIAVNHINARIALLDERISSARLVRPEDLPGDEVRFGAIVKMRMGNETQVFQIVGVDEADISKGKIAFTSPLAKALTHRKVGDIVVLKRPSGDAVFEILHIGA